LQRVKKEDGPGDALLIDQTAECVSFRLGIAKSGRNEEGVHTDELVDRYGLERMER
jgi:hypothetical protein